MWSVARIVKRSRSSWRVPRQNTAASVVSSCWMPSADDGHNRQYHHIPNRSTFPTIANKAVGTRRYLTFGRRHGWKGKDGRGPAPPGDEDKKSFNEKFIDPAARGELQKGHQSGIPKLAVRKHKGHGIRGADPGTSMAQLMKDEEVVFDEGLLDEDSVAGEDDDLLTTLARDAGYAKPPPSPPAKTGAGGYDGPREVQYLEYDNGRGDEYYYWKEEEYDVQDGIMMDDEVYTFDELNQLLFDQQQKSGEAAEDISDLPVDEAALTAHLEKEAKWYLEAGGVDPEEAQKIISQIHNDKEDEDKDSEITAKDRSSETSEDSQNYRPQWRGANDVEDEDELDEDDPDYDVIAELGEHATDADSWWEAVQETPARHVMMQTFADHPDTRREPKPDFPKNRRQPPLDFVEDHHRFLYVSGLPPVAGAEDSKKPTELNALQEQEIEKFVTRLLGVKAEQVFAANDESAFVAFHSAEERDAVVRKAAEIEVLSRDVTASKYDPSKDEGEPKGFLKDVSPDLIVKLENLPQRYNRYNRPCLVRDLFPEDSDVAAGYRTPPENIQFQGRGVAFIRFASEQQAASALESGFVAEQLNKIGKYPARLFKARRELVYQHMGGPGRNHEIRVMGPRLIVDGDMPGRKLHISHAGTIQLRNVDMSLSKEDLSVFFQPYSLLTRDVEGSIEFVTCTRGFPTGKVYVGFDQLGEAEHVVRSMRGKMDIGGTLMTMKLMKDRWMPDAIRREARPEKSEEEILRSLNDWEEYVDPNDIKILEEAGIPKVVLDDALRNIRFQNESFTTLDLAMGDEKLEPEKNSGDNYRQLVQTYVETLKECIATPENPGMLYELMHFPDEEIDVEIFDSERARLKKLLNRREGL